MDLRTSAVLPMTETNLPYWWVSVIEHQRCCVGVTLDKILALV